MKKCKDCKKPTELDDFYSNKKNRDGKTNVCKSCIKSRNAKSYAKDKKKASRKAINARYNKNNKEKRAIGRARYNKANKEQIKIKKALAWKKKKAMVAAYEKKNKFVLDIIEEKTAQEIYIERIKKIMSVPIAEKTTCVYWLMKAYTYSANSNMEPIRLTKGRG